MFEAVGMEVAAGDEGNLSIFNGDGGCRLGTTVEDRQLGDGFAGLVDGQHLLAAVH